jgi:formamidopyrimidine-DNA glycosylase
LPELPEVETVARSLRPGLEGAVIKRGHLGWSRTLEGIPLDAFNAAAGGQRIHKVGRRGKYVTMQLDRDFLTVHLRMTGRLYFAETAEGLDPWVRFSLQLEDGRYLAFSDSRKFGRVYFTPDLDFLEAKLGPEPLGMRAEAIAAIIKGSSRAIKPFLLDQTKIAGIGNIYADESLFRARIHPKKPVDKLTKPQRLRLGGIIPDVLQAAIDHEGASINWYRKPDGSVGESQLHFAVYGREGEPCLNCSRPIRKIVLGQRGTHFCPTCQKR